MCLKVFKFVIESLYGQSHYVEVAALQFGHPYIANPLLYAICTGFVVGTVVGYIVVYFLIGECGKCYVRLYGKNLLLVASGNGNTCNDGVGLSRKFA